MQSLVLLPLLQLRVPQDCELAEQIGHWLDDIDNEDENDSLMSEERNPRPDFRSTECQADLQLLAEYRTRITDLLQEIIEQQQQQEESSLSNPNNGTQLNHNYHNIDETLLSQTLTELQEYAAALHECCIRGFPVTDLQGEGITLTWSTCTTPTSGPQEPQQQSSTTTTTFETHHSLAWERANVLFNIAVIYTYQASAYHNPLQQENNNNTATTPAAAASSARLGWTKVGSLLQNAATIVQYIREKVIGLTGPLHSSLVLSSAFLQVWESYLMAEAQRSAYQTFLSQPRPKHFMLAKLAAAAAPLYQNTEHLCTNQDARLTSVEWIMDWAESVRAWGMWMTALAEYHQSIVHKEKNERGLELARLEGALKFGSFCKEFCESSLLLSTTLSRQVVPMLEEFDQRYETAETENEERYHQKIPEHDELPEVAPQLSVKTDLDNISKLLPALAKPLFAGIMDPTIRRYVDTFRSEIQKVVTQTEWLAEEQTEAGRAALAAVHLPHSLTTYKQEQSGGGIPDEMWDRIECVQRDRKVEHLKEELRLIRTDADLARSTYKQIEDHLEEDLEVDTIFRQTNPQFEGHDVNDIQVPFRQALLNYQRLMASASESDDLLIRRSEVLDSDPKFRLLRLQKSQLDRLVPAGLEPPEIDVSVLSQHLVDLSTLFNERDSLRHNIKEQAKTYNIADDLMKLGSAAPATAYRKVVDTAKASFHGIVEEMRINLEKQTQLMSKIMQENDRFMRIRDQSQETVGLDSPIVKIEDALDEIDQFHNHVQEGRTFYDVIIPKLEKLYQQVEDVSNRLGQERADYEEYSSRPRPPEPSSTRTGNNNNMMRGGGGGYDDHHHNPHHHRMHRSGGGGGVSSYEPQHQSHPRPSSSSRSDPPPTSYNSGRGGGSNGSRGGGSNSNNSNSNGGGGGIRVDDEKFANLVAMDFDPDRVVAALKKHHNDFEQALNELLSGGDL